LAVELENVDDATSKNVALQTSAVVAFGDVVDATRRLQARGATVFFASPRRNANGAPGSKPHLRHGVGKCPFPPESDDAHIDEASVLLDVEVSESGGAVTVVVLSDPGHGFGREAKACALAAAYDPARDGAGTAVAGHLKMRIVFDRPAP
jgi:hypothetical protein